MQHSRRSRCIPRPGIRLSRKYVSLPVLPHQKVSLRVPEMKTYNKNPNIAVKSLHAVGLVDIGYRICSSTNTSPCVSLRRRRTRRQRRCTSRPCLTSSPVSSCSSAVFHRVTWDVGRPQPRAWQRRMARRSGRRSSVSTRCAHPIVACSAFWSGAGWKLSNARIGKCTGDFFLSSCLR